MKFNTTILQTGNNTGIPVSPEVLDALGAGRRPAVTVTVGKHTYRSTIQSMDGQPMISLSAANRAAAGVAGGDDVEVTVELDTAPREVSVPEALAVALKGDAAARKAFEALSYSRQSRITLSVDGAKTEETRQRRVSKALDDLKSGKA